MTNYFLKKVHRTSLLPTKSVCCFVQQETSNNTLRELRWPSFSKFGYYLFQWVNTNFIKNLRGKTYVISTVIFVWGCCILKYIINVQPFKQPKKLFNTVTIIFYNVENGYADNQNNTHSTFRIKIKHYLNAVNYISTVNYNNVSYSQMHNNYWLGQFD